MTISVAVSHYRRAEMGIGRGVGPAPILPKAPEEGLAALTGAADPLTSHLTIPPVATGAITSRMKVVNWWHWPWPGTGGEEDD